MTQVIATFRLLGEDENGEKTSDLNEHEINAITSEEMNDTLREIGLKEGLELISWGTI